MSTINYKFSDGGRSLASSVYKDKNACTVNALANSSKMDYGVAHNICAAAGRPKGKGWYVHLILKVAKKYGIRSRKILRSSLTIQKFLTKHPQGSFYVATKRHAFAIVDGVVMDWKENKPKARLTVGYKIEGSYNGKPVSLSKKK